MNPPGTGFILPMLGHQGLHGGCCGEWGDEGGGQAVSGLADCPSGCWQVAGMGAKLRAGSFGSAVSFNDPHGLSLWQWGAFLVLHLALEEVRWRPSRALGPSSQGE